MKTSRGRFFTMLILICSFTFFSCNNEDDTPPDTAFVDPKDDEPDTPDGGGDTTIAVPNLNGGVLDFETSGPEFEAFGELDGTLVVSFVDNPAMAGDNTSTKVVEVVQTPGTEPWAGFFFSLTEKIDFSTNTAITIKVYSPAAGQKVNLKLEDAADPDINKEINVLTTVANEWEELTFNFNEGDTGKFDKVVLFFNFLGEKTAETTHYFDDMVIAAATIIVDDSSVPTMGAVMPMVAEADVISLFSDAYTDVTVDTFRTEWSNTTLEDVTIGDDNVKKYSALSFVGIETAAAQIDATEMTHFHTDIWTADATELKIKLVDFGPDGAFDGGDDTEHEITIIAPAQEEWVSLDIPLTDFAGLTTKANIAQLIYSAAPSAEATVYVDNIYFRKGTATVVEEPTSAAPTPTLAEADVISMFSDAYTDVSVDTFRTDWSDATLLEFDVNGDAIKKYAALSFVGIESTTTTIDASEMTHFHTDIWTADATEFKIKLVDFGPDGAFDGGDDVEHEITVTAPAQGEWVSLEIPLADFTGLTTTSNIAQLIYVGAPAGSNTVFVDNIYFHK